MSVGPASFYCPDCQADVTEAVWEKANAKKTAVYRLAGEIARRLRRRRERPQTFTVRVTCLRSHTHRYSGRYPDDND